MGYLVLYGNATSDTTAYGALFAVLDGERERHQMGERGADRPEPTRASS